MAMTMLFDRGAGCGTGPVAPSNTPNWNRPGVLVRSEENLLSGNRVRHRAQRVDGGGRRRRLRSFLAPGDEYEFEAGAVWRVPHVLDGEGGVLQ